jgi:hypothetical protein
LTPDFFVLEDATAFFFLDGADPLTAFAGALRAAALRGVVLEATAAFDAGLGFDGAVGGFARCAFFLLRFPESSLRKAVNIDCNLPFTHASSKPQTRDPVACQHTNGRAQRDTPRSVVLLSVAA